jgi:hypothetical protein
MHHSLKYISGSVLVYTMVLVVLWVFMATVVLNVATELSVEYKNRNIEISLQGTITTKSELAMKYARDTNNTGSWFVDVISCPTSVTMDGVIQPAATFSTTLLYATGSFFCQGTYAGNPLRIVFNWILSDIAFADYQWFQIPINSGSTSWVFPDADTTTISLAASYPLLPDGIDDNFDSDNYTAFSTWVVQYPNGYVDNDDDSRRMAYGYIIENSWYYNILWSNTKMKQYIDQNPSNNHPRFWKISNTSSGHLYLDIDSPFRMILYRMSPTAYNTTWELVIQEIITGTGQSASIGYLQKNLSLSAVKTGTGEFAFDFVNNDYALFIENTSTWALLYRLRWENALTGSGIYLNPLKDNDISVFSFLGSHLLIDEEQKLLGNQFEILGLK